MAYTDIDKPSDYFNTILWTGDGTSSRDITGVGFQPDWVWTKSRDDTNAHNLFDVIRGALQRLRVDTTDAEDTFANSLLGFISDGFTVGDNGAINENTESYVAWNWLAGGTASSNTNGSITSQVSANTTSGFSIVSYTGTGSNATVGHGLGVIPSVVITKNRSTTSNFLVYHHKNTSAPQTEYLRLNTTDDTADLNTPWNDTAPTSSVFSVGTATGSNGSGNSMIAYCFAEKKGFSKFGSYTGNGNADGTFVYTGFKPAMIIMKKSSSAGNNWRIFDNKRSTSGSNVIDKTLRPNTTAVEFSSNIDFVSNGVKIRSTDAETNTSGETYIYLAFAENPFVTSTGIPACAK